MMCELFKLLACFHMSGFYVDAALIHSNAGEARLVDRTITSSIPAYDTNGKILYIGTATKTDRQMDDSAQNPYARIAIGYDVQWSAKWSTRLDYSHESSIATGQDHGAERITLGVTWRPFAR